MWTLVALQPVPGSQVASRIAAEAPAASLTSVDDVCPAGRAVKHASNTKLTRHPNSTLPCASRSVVALIVCLHQALYVLQVWFWYQIGWPRPSTRISKYASAHVRPDSSTSSHHDLSVTSAPSPLLDMPLAQFEPLSTLQWPACCRSCRLLPALAITGVT